MIRAGGGSEPGPRALSVPDCHPVMSDLHTRDALISPGPGQDRPAAARQLRIAALGDFHYDPARDDGLAELFREVCDSADVLVLCGDMTTHGEGGQTRGFVDQLRGVDIPIVAVLGNHDYEHGTPDVVMAVLRDRGIHVLDGDSVEIQGVGFAGVKGFGGGFGRGSLGPFGEPEYKVFVKAAIDEALKLENALRALRTPTKVAVLHYSPIPETLVGEPEVIFPFLGSSRLVPPIDTIGASVVFHGHAHVGAAEGRTPAGVPVYNVALPVLRALGLSARIWTAPVPDRRRREGGTAEPGGPGATGGLMAAEGGVAAQERRG
jgi:Icc-related predicted phosphoesterase